MLRCPNCQSTKVVKNARIHNGKQNHRFRDCGRQFVENSQQKIISSDTTELIDKLLLEKIPLAGIARVCDVSEPWLQMTSCKRLWQSLPGVYRQCAVAYSDFWSAYGLIFPSKRHRFVSKETGKTSYIERFNCTLRQRVSRLVRKTLSFSKRMSEKRLTVTFVEMSCT
ncbi:IS1 transposase [[Leptolyngbya] sp. PCC 7376]|nr:IS1 family transposase [[Leptolyngbya] sp. PCC 7376]AFY39573.1 IS1 transposase [[Leptolyngbya] sp. PCC 7376]